jgi:single-stranded-DNA-specific exonuclease
VVFNRNWHKGVVGIVASRLIEHHYRPTIVLTESNGKVGGSARSVKGFNVHDAIGACSDLLEQFGGHMYAAGLTLKPENVEAFRDRFEEVVRARIEPSMRVPEEEVDLEIALADIAPPFIRGIQGMEPFGPCNMKPVLLTRGVTAKDVRLIGSGGDHLKFKVCDPKQPTIELDAIAFRQGEHFDLLRNGAPFSMLYHIELNEWRGNSTVQLNIKDIKPGIAKVLKEEVGRNVEKAGV